MFSTQTELLRQLNAGRATGGFDRKMQTLVRVPLLIIDDFGLKPFKPGQDEDFHDLIAERYERRAMIVTGRPVIAIGRDRPRELQHSCAPPDSE